MPPLVRPTLPSAFVPGVEGTGPIQGIDPAIFNNDATLAGSILNSVRGLDSSHGAGYATFENGTLSIRPGAGVPPLHRERLDLSALGLSDLKVYNLGDGITLSYLKPTLNPDTGQWESKPVTESFNLKNHFLIKGTRNGAKGPETYFLVVDLPLDEDGAVAADAKLSINHCVVRERTQYVSGGEYASISECLRKLGSAR